MPKHPSKSLTRSLQTSKPIVSVTTDIAGYQLAVLKWTLPPDEIDFAVRCYQETEKILKNKRTTRKRLLEVYQAHLQLLLFREAISDSRRQEHC